MYEYLLGAIVVTACILIGSYVIYALVLGFGGLIKGAVAMLRLPSPEEVYMEPVLLEQEARERASWEALQVVNQVPDQDQGVLILGVPINDEAYLQKPTLLRKVARREAFVELVHALARRHRR